LEIRIFEGTIDAIACRVQAGKLDLGVGIFERTPGVRRVPFFRFSLMVIRADKNGAVDRTTRRWSSLNGQTLISLTTNYPHQQLIDKELAKAKVICRSVQTVNLLDTQIGLVEAEQGIAIIPSFALPACRNRKVAMSELVDPTVSLEFYQISSRGETAEDADEFSAFLKKYIARWAEPADCRAFGFWTECSRHMHRLRAKQPFCHRPAARFQQSHLVGFVIHANFCNMRHLLAAFQQQPHLLR
jgi:DNA-binding transcriptional LysR family regulator